MPCTDSGPSTAYYQERLDRLTKMLCGLCAQVEAIGRYDLISADPELSPWWPEHKLIDQRRREAEAAAQRRENVRQALLARLTDEERKALGF